MSVSSITLPNQPTSRHLEALLWIRRGFLQKEWVKVRVMGISDKGMLMRTDEILPIGSTATFQLTLALDFGDISIDRIDAKVLSSKKVCSCFDYQLSFAFPSSTSKAAALQKQVKQITELLGRYDALVAKLQSGPLGKPSS